MKRAIFVAGIVFCGCSAGGVESSSLALSTNAPSIEDTAKGSVERVTFVATAAAVDVSTTTTFELDDLSAGHFEGATFVSTPSYVGTVTVHATHASTTRDVTLTILRDGTVRTSAQDDWETPMGS